MASPPHSEPHAAERRFTRSVLAGLFLLGLVALAGPLLSYQSDVDEMRHQFRSRVAREGRGDAQLLKSELARVALGVGPDLQQERSLEDVQDLTGPNTGLFRQGIVLMDATGEVRWSEPPRLLSGSPLLTRSWFQQLLVQQTPVVDALSPGASTFVVAVPIVRERKTLGVLAGLLDANADLPGARPTR